MVTNKSIRKAYKAFAETAVCHDIAGKNKEEYCQESIHCAACIHSLRQHTK